MKNRDLSGSSLCLNKDPLNWGKVADAMKSSHLEEVTRMVKEFRQRPVRLDGEGLKISHVAAVATMAGEVTVELSEAVKTRVNASSEWVMESMRKGTDGSGMTAGFGAMSHRRTNQGGALQTELIRLKSILLT